MKLSECTYGILVMGRIHKPESIGMIVGLTCNEQEEPVPLVKWHNCTAPMPYHHDNLRQYEE